MEELLVASFHVWLRTRSDTVKTISPSKDIDIKRRLLFLNEFEIMFSSKYNTFLYCKSPQQKYSNLKLVENTYSNWNLTQSMILAQYPGIWWFMTALFCIIGWNCKMILHTKPSTTYKYQVWCRLLDPASQNDNLKHVHHYV